MLLIKYNCFQDSSKTGYTLKTSTVWKSTPGSVDFVLIAAHYCLHKEGEPTSSGPSSAGPTSEEPTSSMPTSARPTSAAPNSPFQSAGPGSAGPTLKWWNGMRTPLGPHLIASRVQKHPSIPEEAAGSLKSQLACILPCPPLGMLKGNCSHHHASRNPGCPCRGPDSDCLRPTCRGVRQSPEQH